MHNEPLGKSLTIAKKEEMQKGFLDDFHIAYQPQSPPTIENYSKQTGFLRNKQQEGHPLERESCKKVLPEFR